MELCSLTVTVTLTVNKLRHVTSFLKGALYKKQTHKQKLFSKYHENPIANPWCTPNLRFLLFNSFFYIPPVFDIDKFKNNISCEKKCVSLCAWGEGRVVPPR